MELSIFETTLLHGAAWQTLAFPEVKHNFISPFSFFSFQNSAPEGNAKGSTKHQKNKDITNCWLETVLYLLKMWFQATCSPDAPKENNICLPGNIKSKKTP